MKIQWTAVNRSHPHRGFHVAAILLLLKSAAYAQGVFVDNSPHATASGSSSYTILIGFLIALTATLFFLFHRRYHMVANELKDLTAELGTTRQRLTETGKELDQEQKDHKATNNRYQGILFDASVGMFQMDTDGKCTYVNTALQEMSGLYPKKALTEGLANSIHPDDQASFKAAWKSFIDENESFNETFRFRFTKGREVREVHVACRANKIYNSKKDVESYIGWVTNVSAFHEQQIQQQAETKRYSRFVTETTEGYYQLSSKDPISLSPTPAKMAVSIMESMVLTDCNDTFAAMYGVQPAELIGKAINELQGGCGPFKDKNALVAFVENNYKTSNHESVRQDPNGTRLNLLNNVVGMIEDNQLVGIWGAQRYISEE